MEFLSSSRNTPGAILFLIVPSALHTRRKNVCSAEGRSRAEVQCNDWLLKRVAKQSLEHRFGHGQINLSCAA